MGVQKSKEPKAHAKAKNDSAKKTERGSAEIPFVVDTQGHRQTPTEAKETKTAKDRAAYVEGRTLLFTGVAAIAAVALVFIGLGGVIAAIRSLKAIEGQVELMKVPYRSVVALEDWAAKYYPEGLWKLEIQVSIVNQTQFPLTITGGRINLKNVGGPGYTTYGIGEGTFLPRTPHIIKAPLLAGGDHMETFLNRLLSIPIDGHITHFGPLGQSSAVTQRFSGYLECGDGKDATFMYETHMNPVSEPNNNQGEQEAN